MASVMARWVVIVSVRSERPVRFTKVLIPELMIRDQGLHDLILTAPGDPGVELNVFRHMILVRQIQFLRLLTQPL